MPALAGQVLKLQRSVKRADRQGNKRMLSGVEQMSRCEGWKGLEHETLAAKGRSSLQGVSASRGCTRLGLRALPRGHRENTREVTLGELGSAGGGVVTACRGQRWIVRPRGWVRRPTAGRNQTALQGRPSQALFPPALSYVVNTG